MIIFVWFMFAVWGHEWCFYAVASTLYTDSFDTSCFDYLKATQSDFCSVWLPFVDIFTCLAHLASPQNENEVCLSTWRPSVSCNLCVLHCASYISHLHCLLHIYNCFCLKHPDDVELVVLYPESGVRSLSGSPWKSFWCKLSPFWFSVAS